MSAIGIIKAAKAAKAARAARGVWTVVEAIDVTMDAGNLADDLCRHYLGENYSPTERDLYRRVCDAGLAYDQVVEQVLQADADVSNLLASLTLLSEIQISYGQSTDIIYVSLDKIDRLRERLANSIPTTYAWFATIRLQAVNNRFDQNQITPPTGPVAPWWEYGMRGVLIPVEIYSVHSSYQKYKKTTAGGDAESDSRRLRRRNAQADIFSGIDPESIQQVRNGHISRVKRIRAGLSRAGTLAGKAIGGVATLGSFVMNVYSIYNKITRHHEAIAEFQKQLSRYTNDKEIYGWVLNGIPKVQEANPNANPPTAAIFDEAAFLRLSEFFFQEEQKAITAEPDPTRRATLQEALDQQKAALASIKPGYNATKEEYGKTICQILTAMDDAYASMLSQFNEARGSGNTFTQEANVTVTKLTESQTAFRNSVGQIATAVSPSPDPNQEYTKFALKPIQPANTPTGNTSVIVKETIDAIAKAFTTSVASKLKSILTTLNQELADFSALNQLLSFADDLLEREKEIEAKKVELRAKLKTKQERKVRKERALSTETDQAEREELEEEIRELEEEINEITSEIAEQETRFEGELDRQARLATDILNRTAENRITLRDSPAVKDALRRQIEELKQPPRVLRIDSIDDCIEISRDPFTSNTAFTITLWVKPSRLNSGWQGILGKQGDAYRKPGLWLAPEGNGLHYDSYSVSPSGPSQRFDGRLDSFFESPNQWVHIAWVKEGTEYKFYRNGELFGTTKPAPETFYTTNSSYWLGRVDNFVIGEMGDVRFWGRARTQDEIKAAMNRHSQTLNQG